jgi:ABC-type transport system involved in multi-copper enzyme maturation permease subunit
MGTTFRYLLLTALRDRVFAAIALMLLLIALLASFIGDGALVEEPSAKLTFAGAATRMVYVLGIILFITFHMRRTAENREIDMMLSRPVSRTGLLLAFYLGFAGLALLLVPFAAIVLRVAGKAPLDGYLLWIWSLALEGLVVTAIALFFALLISSATAAALASIGLYIFGRMVGSVLGVLTGNWVDLSTPTMKLTSTVFRIVSSVMPRLDLFGQTSWLVYGAQNNALDWTATVQTLIYVPLLLAMAIYDFERKQF